MKILKQIWTLMASMVLITACTQDIPTVSLGIDDIYYLERMKSYKLTPAFTGQEYRWTMKTASGKDSLVSTESTYIFLQKDEGTYDMTFEIIDPVTPYKHDFRFIVIHEEIEYSPYIAHIYEYRPAPGQFINTMPEYKAGDTEADMCKKVEESISGTNNISGSLRRLRYFRIRSYRHERQRRKRFHGTGQRFLFGHRVLQGKERWKLRTRYCNGSIR